MSVFSPKTHPLLKKLKGTEVEKDSTILQRRENKRPCAVCRRPTEYGFRLPTIFRYICSDACGVDFFTSGSVERDKVGVQINSKHMAGPKPAYPLRKRWGKQ